jgi:hypothetical protein
MKKSKWIISAIDPHWSGPAGSDQHRAESEKAYEALREPGIEFRGYRFWPPFFCMHCGIGVSASQWLFSRCCGACDSDLGLLRGNATGRKLFAGRVGVEEATRNGPNSIVDKTEKRGGFLDPRTPEGYQMATLAQSINRPAPKRPVGRNIPGLLWRRRGIMR